MIAHKKTLSEFFYSTKPLVIPVYQRNYTWRKENCKLLFHDILNISDSNMKHFIGSIVFVDDSEAYVIIDGQQRVTTISILLLALRNAILNGDVVSDDASLVDQINYRFLINQFAKDNNHRMKLKPFRDDSKAYDALFRNIDEFVEESIITSNYHYFYEEILAHNINPTKFFDAIQGRLEFVEVKLIPSDGDNPQLVFETINSTGVSLNETDKIRNYVLMGLNANTQEDFYNTYWLPIERYTNIHLEDFMRDYLTMKLNSIPNKGDVYRVFKEYVLEHYTNDIEPLLVDLKSYAQIFKSIKEAKVGTTKMNEIMANLEQLEIATTYPFLLAMLNYHQEGKLASSEVERVLDVMEVFLFRRIMSGYYNTGLNKVFANMHNRILKQMYGDYSYSEVFIYLLQHGISYWEFPNDTQFVRSFEEREVYKMRSNYRLYLFYKLEESMNKEAEGTKKKIEDGVLSIEHIMPQTLTDDWRKELGTEFSDEDFEKCIHNIGNLTLTAYNTEYSNRKFAEKRDGIASIPTMKGFRYSCVAMNKYVSEQEHWTIVQMKERCNELAQTACSIWSYPTTKYVPAVVEEESIPIDADYKFKGRYIKSYSFNGATSHVDSWADAFTRIVKTLYEIDGSILYHLAHDASENYFLSEPNKSANKIAEGIYLHVACNTNNKLRQIHRLLAMYKFEPDDISVVLYPQKEPQNQKT